MSHSITPSRSVTPLPDEDAEARELLAYLGQQDPVDVMAADWHTRGEQGLTSAEQVEFQHWLAANTDHMNAFMRLDQGIAAVRSIPVIQRPSASVRSAQLANGAAPTPQEAVRQTEARQRQSGLGQRMWFLPQGLFPRPALVAFFCVALLAAGIGWHQWQQWPTFSASYAAARGQRLNATLPDGTEMALDVDTQASVTLYRNRREVRINEGQVMFSVAPDSEKPFHVLAGPATVTVVGTRFSVRYRNSGADAGKVNVAVEEGRVRVLGSPAVNDGATRTPIELTAGQGIAVLSDGVVGRVAAVAPGSVALWQKGMVRFDNTSLADALLELERYGPTNLVVRDPTVAALLIGGSYQIDRPADFARVLPRILPVQLVAGADGRTEIVRSR